jgi:ParB family transcriptional regulator, chromosome partitioning protein
MAKVGMDLSNLFTGAAYSQELSELQQQNAQLMAEIEALKAAGSTDTEGKIEQFREQLAASGGTISIELSKIKPNPQQPRRTFLQESIEAIARSLSRDGQLEPIILIELSSSEYLIFDGERRWRGATSLNWKSLNAVLIPATETLHRQSLVASLQREDLNPLDLAEALLKEISTVATLAPEDISRMLHATIRRMQRQQSLSVLSELGSASLQEQERRLSEFELDDKERSLLKALLDLQLNPASIDANIFPILKLSDDLKAAIRQQGLGGIQALALNRLSAKNLKTKEKLALKTRTKVLQQVLAEKLSVAQTRKLVGQLLAQDGEYEPKDRKILTAVKTVEGISLDEIGDKSQIELLRSVLLTKLEEVERKLGS